MTDVLCVAECCCDIIFGGLDRVPAPGEEEYCREFCVKAGGGANTAMGLARLGADVKLATRLGQDAMGGMAAEFIRKTGVDMSAVRMDASAVTPVSAVLSTREDRCFASYGGDGGDFLDPAGLEDYIRESRHVHTYVGYCRRYPIIELCEKHGKTLSLDTSFYDSTQLESTRDALSHCRIFTPNETEACALAQTGDVMKALDILSAECPHVVITLGGAGSVTKAEGRVYRALPARVPCVKDSTGAGDLFCAGYIYGFLQGWDVQKTLDFASKSGGLAVTYYGGIDESYTFENVSRLTF
ncbi:MAG TPA: carbohydrate kinase family protein [Firmicutes bacterium]|nr:carbohydrate kinase family protein [Bacillota bacterium]